MDGMAESKRIENLRDALRSSQARMAGFRQQRVRFLREYAGPYYGKADSTGAETAPVWHETMNTVFDTIRAVMPALKLNPKVQVRTRIEELHAFATLFGLRMNALLEEVQAADAFKEAILSAFFGFGIIKTGVTASGPERAAKLSDQQIERDPGELYVSYVDDDDYVIDLWARKRQEAQFEGNRFRMRFDEAMDSGLYDKKLLEKAKKEQDQGPREPQAEDISRDSIARRSKSLNDMVEMIELWQPSEGTLVTVAGEIDAIHGYLNETQYDGPDQGPYDLLGYAFLPNNLLPIPWAGVTFDLHLLINLLCDKIGDKAQRQKDCPVVMPGSGNTAAVVRDAQDGDLIEANPNHIGQISIGGVKSDDYQPVAFYQSWMNRLSGNTDLLGGKKTAEPTLGQSEMVQQNAFAAVASMRDEVMKMGRSVVRKLAWYAWRDRETTQQLKLRIPGAGEIPVTWLATRRRGEFAEYDFNIQPYSAASDSPVLQYERMKQWIAEIVLPLAAIGAAQGTHVDVAKIIRMTGEQLNIVEADELTVNAPPAAVGSPPATGGMGSARLTGQGGRGSASPGVAPMSETVAGGM